MNNILLIQIVKSILSKYGVLISVTWLSCYELWQLELRAYPAEQHAHLNPQAASMMSVSAINKLSDVEEVKRCYLLKGRLYNFWKIDMF